MITTISVTKNWQIHIPKDLRVYLGLDRPGKIKLTVKNDSVILKPVKSTIMSFAGKYPLHRSKRKINIDNIRDQIDYGNL